MLLLADIMLAVLQQRGQQTAVTHLTQQQQQQ
jgi:hypothetical protein